MSVRIVNWNVQWAKPGSWNAAPIVERILSCAPDVVCLTETDEHLLPPGHVVSSDPDCGYTARGKITKRI